jgi:hypothetical protein
MRESGDGQNGFFFAERTGVISSGDPLSRPIAATREKDVLYETRCFRPAFGASSGARPWWPARPRSVPSCMRWSAWRHGAWSRG